MSRTLSLKSGKVLTKILPQFCAPYSQTDARPFQDITDTQQDQLLADLTAAAIARE
jgi:hypothetical protein